jgi:uncharacterized protein (TIGR03437 family)
MRSFAGFWRLAAAGLFPLLISTALAQQPACTSVTLSPGNTTVGGNGGAGAITVTGVSPTGCKWTAASDTPWISISFGSSGVLGGTVGYTVNPNPSVNQRVGSITVSGRVFQITQTGASCSTSLPSSSTTFNASGGSGSFTVSTAEGCSWSAQASVSWIGITSGTGSGMGTVRFTVAANAGASIRFGAISVGTATFTVTQSGFSCSYSVSPSSASAGSAGGAGTFTVNAPAGCTWTATSNNPDWLSVTSGASGSGTAPAGYNALANTGAGSRTGTISVGTATFTVSQPASCGITLSPAQMTVTAGATTGMIRVTANLNSCERPAYSDSAWLTITSGANDIGSGEIGYKVTANTSPAPRTGNVFVGAQVFTLTQIAPNCTTSLSANFVSMPNTGGQGRINIASTCSWTAAADVNWIRFTSATSGAANGYVTFTVAQNLDPQPRSASIAIGDQVVSIRQDGTPQSTTCTYSISPATWSLPAGGGSGTVAVTVDDGCTWSATTATPWITITSAAAGSGNGEIAYAAAANTAASQRQGAIVIAGKTFTLDQAGTACTYSIAPRSASFPSSGGSGTIDVTSPCTWGASSNRNWIAIAGGATGTGNGTAAYTVAANGSVQSRGGVITVAGLAFNVSQTGVSCTVTLAKTSAGMAAPGGSGTFGVTGTNGCDWSATTGAEWLDVSWAGVDGSGTVYYTAKANGAAAPRSAQINVAGQFFTLTQEFGPVVASAGVVNAASFARTPASPGLIVTLFGTVMGPDQLATLELTPDRTGIAKELAGTKVFFDDVPAPIVYTSAGQVSAIVPYAVADTGATRVVVEYNGTKSNAIQLPVAASAPAIFTINASGAGQGAILNQNNNVNSATSPAGRNTVVQIFATGEGLTDPAGVDGRLTPANVTVRPKLPVTVRIGNIDAPVTYAGSSPGLVAGLIQINARIAANAPLGDAVPVVISVGGVPSQPGVTMVIR